MILLEFCWRISSKEWKLHQSWQGWPVEAGSVSDIIEITKDDNDDDDILRDTVNEFIAECQGCWADFR